ncbi:MAG TPA: 23S rRNA (guanosine(2251)-2'-O)-methyltransferase RlmB [Edaphocola sp.]|nr:23S rRNA (guanosine(2251)-2'-O)-methyltransferase RlmB [Edaphocola sp.]
MSYQPNNNFKRNKPGVPKNRLIIGRKPLIESLNEAKDIEKIFMLKSATGEELGVIKSLAKKMDIAISYVPIEKLNGFTQANHQGVVAVASLVNFLSLQDIIDQIVDKGEVPFFVLLDGITDTRNLGAIARSAFAFNAQAIIIPSSNNAAITEEGIKASAGALERISVCRVGSVEQAIDTLKLNGIKIIASTLDANDSIHDLPFDEPVAIVLGAEDKGVGTYVLKTADFLVKIPMSTHFDSLNVSVAAGIMFYNTFLKRTQ